MKPWSGVIGLVLLGALLAGCDSRPETQRGETATPSKLTSSDSDERVRLTLQTDWYPEPEQGGFYQALARGFYRDAGLDVTIAPGGQGAMVLQKLGLGQVPLALWRSDDVTVAISRDVPIVCIAAVYQRDAQALMFHADHPVRDFSELGDRVVMAGAASVWVQVVENRYGFEIHRTPLTFSVAQFLRDPWLVQQCLVTSEPFTAEQAGAKVETLLLARAGYEPYPALVANRDWLASHSDIATAFVRASYQGWDDFLNGDPSPAFSAIVALNPQHTPDSMAYARDAMLREHLVTGDRPGEHMGAFDVTRLKRTARQLFELGVAARLVPSEELVAPGFPLKSDADSAPDR